MPQCPYCKCNAATYPKWDDGQPRVICYNGKYYAEAAMLRKKEKELGR